MPASTPHLPTPTSQLPRAQTLIQRLCRQGVGRRLPSSPHQVFPHLRPRTPNFHCTSFFRTEKTPPARCNPHLPFHFSDGRVYEVLDFQIVAGSPSNNRASENRASGRSAYSSSASENGASNAGAPSPAVAYRCCVDVIERQSSEFIPFEVWFYPSAFEEDAGDETAFNESRYNEGSFEGRPFAHNPFADRPLDETAKRRMIEFTRQWIWEFLYTKRNAVGWSRYGYPYVCECR